LTNVKNNPLLHRREVEFRVESPSTPSRGEIRRSLAVLLKVDLSQVYVREIKTKTGTHESVGWAHVYEDAEEALRIEPQYVVERNQFKESEEAEAQ